jgi:hypothetical protein
MNKIKIKYKLLIGSLFTAMLMMVTVQVDFEMPFTIKDLAITANEAQAHPQYQDMELADAMCWETGETFLKCVHGSYVCDVRDQGTCSGTDPEEG